MFDATVFLRVVGIIAASIVLFRLVILMNRSSRKTRPGIRAASVIIAAGVAGTLAWLLDDRTDPDWLTVMLLVGMAVFVWCDKRAFSLKKLSAPSNTSHRELPH